MLFSHNLYACIEGEIQTSKIKLPLLFSYTLLMFLYVVIAFAQAYSYQGLSIHPIFALTYGYSTLTSQTNNKAIWSEATNKHSTPYQRITLHCAALIYHSLLSLRDRVAQLLSESYRLHPLRFNWRSLVTWRIGFLILPICL